jgi:hypothetical protein
MLRYNSSHFPLAEALTGDGGGISTDFGNLRTAQVLF